MAKSLQMINIILFGGFLAWIPLSFGFDTCPVGKFGYVCSKTCHCKDSTEKCDEVLGKCESGCHENWTGFDCQMPQSYRNYTSTTDIANHSYFTRYEDHCYYMNYMDSTYFYDAKRKCRLLNMDLLTIHSVKEQKFIENMTRRAAGLYGNNNTKWWLGLRHRGDGNVLWEDDSSFDFVNWKPFQPEFWNGENCAVFLPDGKWDGQSCKSSIESREPSFICKTSKDCTNLRVKCYNDLCMDISNQFNGDNNVVTAEEIYGYSKCGPNDFYCNYKCISRNFLCNGYNDCNDGADENQCGPPTNSNEINGLQDKYGVHVNMPFRIDFQVEGSPNAQINSVLVVTDERQPTNLQNNRHWNHTSVKSTFSNSKYVTNLSLEIYNVTSDVIDCDYYLNVSDASGFTTTFSFRLRWIAIPSDADGTIPVKYIHFDALKTSTIALIIKIKGYPDPHLSDIIGVGSKGDNHSILPKWTCTVRKEDLRPFITIFTLQSQYHTGDVLFHKYIAVIKNSEGSTNIQFQLLSQAESNATHENSLKTAVLALGVVIFVVCALAVVYKISGQSLPIFRMRRKPVTKKYIGLEPVIHFNTANPEDGSEVYDEIADKFEEPQDVVHLEDGYNVISRLSADYEEALNVEDGYITILNEHASEIASDRSRGANSLGNVNCTGEAMLNVNFQLDSNPNTDGENDCLKNISIGSVSSEYLEPVQIGNTTQTPALSPDYLHPAFVFSGSRGEKFIEDNGNIDELAESENCQAELSDTMI